jgi:hypothetical protein
VAKEQLSLSILDLPLDVQTKAEKRFWAKVEKTLGVLALDSLNGGES